jgi:hypothetical protein
VLSFQSQKRGLSPFFGLGILPQKTFLKVSKDTNFASIPQAAKKAKKALL